MATTATLRNVPWAVGTTVGVYPAAATNPGGTAITTAVVAGDGTLTFSGLLAGAPYRAGALVGGQWRWQDFMTDAAAPALVGGGLDLFDVRDYGAKGDNVASDSERTAIQAAVDAAAADGGGVVYIPPGHFRWNNAEPVTVDDNDVILQGCGSVSELRNDGGDIVNFQGAVANDGINYASLRDLSLRGSGIGQANRCVRVKNSEFATLDNVLMTSMKYGLWIEDSYFSQFKNVRTEGGIETGLYVKDTTGYTGQLTFLGCKFVTYANGGAACILESAGGNQSIHTSTFLNTTFQSTPSFTGTKGLHIVSSGPRSASFINCDFEAVVTGVLVQGRSYIKFVQPQFFGGGVMTRAFDNDTTDGRIEVERPRFNNPAGGAIKFYLTQGSSSRWRIIPGLTEGTWTETGGIANPRFYLTYRAGDDGSTQEVTTVPIDSTGVKTVTIPHGWPIQPRENEIMLGLRQVTAVDDFALDWIKVVSVDATNITAKVKVVTASATPGATISLVAWVGGA